MSGEEKKATGGHSETMERGNRAVIVVFLLWVIAEMPAEGNTMDVCDTCHPNATCEDKSDGSGKVCNCKYGFVGNGRTYCQDKDECQIGSSRICGQHTTCHNTYGSYYCTCLGGYSPSNDMATFIPNDGTHCQDIDECRIPGLCGEGGQCRNLEGSFECSCQLGYQVHNGLEPFNPHTDRAFCKVVDCGRPASVEDTVLLSVTGTTYGSVAMYVCDEGFVRKSGDNSSVCGADGRWRGPTLVCEEVDCGPPPALPNSSMLWNKLSSLGTKVLYLCNSGFDNVGKGNISICNAAGQWEIPSVLCQEILCGNPPIVESTELVWDSNSRPGSTVLYVCKEGFYNKGGHNVSICNANGQWTTPALSCQEILCGDAPIVPHAGQVWDGSSTPGTTVTYYCKTGFYHNEGNNMSLCTINGYWTKPNISCKEVDCGVPPYIPQSVMLWDKISTVGSQVVYQCNSGYSSAEEGNVSVCTASGEWVGASLVCQEISCGPPLTLPHTNLLWDGTSRPGSVVLYECMDGFYHWKGNNISTCLQSGQWGKVSAKCKAKCGPVPFLPKSEVAWHNRSVVIHRCVDGYHSWRGSNMSVCGSSGEWQRATLRCIEIKPPVNHLFVVNEKCLHWRAEKYEDDTEVYKVTYTGSRDFQRSFHDKRKRFLSSKSDQLELCLNLLPVTNYSISITAVSARFTVTVTTNTSLPVPPAPVVYYREFETPVPTLRLRRSPDTLDPISVYQVFVLPAEGIMVFDCSSPANSDPSNKVKSPTEYITAQIDVRHVGTEMNFTVGDGLYYGGFFNAPLENGRNNYIILRAVSQWQSALKSSCVLWAKVRGTSYVLKVSSLSAAALIGVVVLVILGGYCFTWFFKRT
ncbi:sushi domain-containing protein 1 isoform X3 [Plectropomus leopardus]|uniref:sushi domain-containing protein 1 isoform X3 n=1 Tax=Plectropomus leopardus TaxID=160734 RepID=UPI001C4C4162|nr:sushi domain-containing protein 1 isoform X3 [Plectropomus leopardus]